MYKYNTLRSTHMPVYTQIYYVVCALDIVIYYYFVFCVPGVRVTVSTRDFVYFVFLPGVLLF